MEPLSVMSGAKKTVGAIAQAHLYLMAYNNYMTTGSAEDREEMNAILYEASCNVMKYEHYTRIFRAVIDSEKARQTETT